MLRTHLHTNHTLFFFSWYLVLWSPLLTAAYHPDPHNPPAHKSPCTFIEIHFFLPLGLHRSPFHFRLKRIFCFIRFSTTFNGNRQRLFHCLYPAATPVSPQTKILGPEIERHGPSLQFSSRPQVFWGLSFGRTQEHQYATRASIPPFESLVPFVCETHKKNVLPESSLDSSWDRKLFGQ